MTTDSSASPLPAHSVPTIARRWAATLILAVVVIAGVHLRASHQKAIRDAERLVEALSRTLAYQVDTSLRAVDALMEEVSQRVDPEQWHASPLVEVFSLRLQAFPEIRNLVILSPDGRGRAPVLGPDGPEEKLLDLRDRPYVQAHLGAPEDRTLHIGDPVRSRVDGRPTIPLSRAMIDSRGRFRGMVVAAIDPAFLVDSLERVLVEPEGGTAVIRRDGIFLARLPDPEAHLGRSTASSALFRLHVPKNPSSVARFVSVADGNLKIVAYRSLERFPVVTTVGITEKTALTDFRREALWIILVVTGLSAALFRLAWLSDRREHSRTQLAARLERQSRILEQQVAERTHHLAEAQAAAEQRARQLAAGNADLEQFIHVAAHDLQEPLRSISGFVQLLQHRYRNRLDSEANDFIFYVVEGTRRMQQQILDLMAYAQIRGQGGPFLPTPLGETAAEAVRGLDEMIAEVGATVTIGPLPTLPTDRPQMVMLFRNLIGNSVKFGRPGLRPHVEIGAEPDENGDSWAFWVRDDGIGIEPQYAERVFQMFQKLHTRDHDAGTGMGLTICRRIVERHGGRIWADCRQDSGTTIRFTLPATPPES